MTKAELASVKANYVSLSFDKDINFFEAKNGVLVSCVEAS